MNKEAIIEMNNLPGTAYPEYFQSLGVETVQVPKGVVIPGDLSGTGASINWSGLWIGHLWYDGFDQDYEVNGNGLCKYPVFEGYGNHDVQTEGNYAVPAGIYYRNKSRATPINLSKEGLHYSWDWENLHLVHLNIFPGRTRDAQNSLDFLIEDLNNNLSDSRQPIILFYHYDFFSDPNRWFSDDEREVFYQAIENYNIIGIFVGHLHQTVFQIWNNIPVFTAPTVKQNINYYVVRGLDDTLFVAERLNGSWGQYWMLSFENPFEEKNQ